MSHAVCKAACYNPMDRHPAAFTSAAKIIARSRRRTFVATSVMLIGGFIAGLSPSSPLPVANVPASSSSSAREAEPPNTKAFGSLRSGTPLADRWMPCAISGGTCRCTGTLVFSDLLGTAVREINVNGEAQCSAEALGAPSSIYPRVCWCLRGVAWGDEVRSGLASMVRRGLTPRIEIAADEAATDAGCNPEGDGLWYGCVTMSRRWDATVVPQVMMRTASVEEQLDMSLRKLDACRHLAPDAALRVLGVKSGQSADAITIPVSAAQICTVVFRPEDGVVWTAKINLQYCATQPGTCTTTPCECRRSTDVKIELRTVGGQRCWACAKQGEEHMFHVNVLAERMDGGAVSWWPPYGINCPPLLWIFMDWRAVLTDCPAISCVFGLFIAGLLIRKFEEKFGVVPWTRVAPLFGPTLKRGEVWRFFTFTFFHLQFVDLFQSTLTMLDMLDVEGTPAIILGDGSNLKCGVGAKQNFMCYPSIGIGSCHTFGVALLSAAVGGMCSTWVSFEAVVTGASALGFGMSGAVVGLYGLYAGAELDQVTSVQRSFQDWVHLRLIFVAFHIAMECIRGISHRDAMGLFAHSTSLIAGVAYVLYFLPPMGDGTMFASERPYVVPCEVDVGSGVYADGSVPECIRLFSQFYEYEVSDVRYKIRMLFTASIAFTIVNTRLLQRASGNEAMELGGLEVSAVLCAPKRATKFVRTEGDDVILWSEVTNGENLQAVEGCSLAVEVRIVPADSGGGLSRGGGQGENPPEATACTRSVEGGPSPEWKESLFLPVKYSQGSFLEVVLWDKTSTTSQTPLAFAATRVTAALRYESEQRPREHTLRLQEINGSGRGRGAVSIRLQCISTSELRQLRNHVKKELDNTGVKIGVLSAHLAHLQHVAQEEDDSSGTTATQHQA